MPVHIECAKRTFNVLTLSTKNCNVFSLGQCYSSVSCFSFFMNRNLSLRIYTAIILLNVFDRITRFVICNYVKRGESQF